MSDALWTSMIFLAGASYGGLLALWLCSCDDRAPLRLRNGYRPRRNTKRVSPPQGTSAVPPKPEPVSQPAISGVIVRTVELPRARRA